MANKIYPLFMKSLTDADANSALTGSGSTGVWCALVDTGTYTYSSAHQFYSSLSGIGGTDQEVTTITTTASGGNMIIDGNDITFAAVAGTVSYEALVLYRKNAGANTTWRLIAYIDTSVTGLPVTSNGGDIIVTWNGSGIINMVGP